jgi:hypothetical protein
MALDRQARLLAQALALVTKALLTLTPDERPDEVEVLSPTRRTRPPPVRTSRRQQPTYPQRIGAWPPSAGCATSSAAPGC